MAVPTADFQAYYDDLNWDDFNDLNLNQAAIDNDLAAVAEHRLQAAFDAAQDHYLRSAPEGTSASMCGKRGHDAYVVFHGRKTGVYRTW